MGWVLAITTVLMIGMTWAAMIVGVHSQCSAGERLRQAVGKAPTVCLGLCVFLIVAIFQSSNNRALLLAGELVYPEINSNPLIAATALVIFNAAIIAFFLFARSIYRVIEKAMLLMVGTMLLCFGMNAFLGELSFVEMFSALLPRPTAIRQIANQWTGDLRAMIGTTFSVAGAYYQTYLVRERGWTKDQLKRRWIDPVVGISTLGFLTLLIMGTAAAALHGKVDPKAITDLRSLASSLQPTFGPLATIVFAGGILAGAISSFIGNAMIGGTILSDCVGGGARANERLPRILTIAALLFGMMVALLSVALNYDSVAFIVVAQGLTTLGLPVMALTILCMLLATDRKRYVLIANVIIGCVVSLYVASVTFMGLIS